MSSVKEAATVINGQNDEETLEWSYIEWKEQVGSSMGLCSVQTQTTAPLTEDKETQTSRPQIMLIDLPRTPSKLKSAGLLEADGFLTPLFQFNRHALGRISTSPTLRRMRTSTRRPRVDFTDPTSADGGQVGSVSGEAQFPEGLLSPGWRTKSPLAASPLSDAEPDRVSPSGSNADKEEDRSSHPNSVDNGVIFERFENIKIDGEPTEDSDQETDGPPHNRLQERRRSSVVVSLPGLDVSPGDLFVSDGAADRLNGSTLSESKKSKWPFSRHSTIKGRMKFGIEKCLSTVQIQDWRDTDFQRYKNCSLEDFLKSEGREGGADDDDEEEARDWRKEKAVWELFTSECVYFLDQLMVLKEVFLHTLTCLQHGGYLQDVEPWRLFANLNELSLVSFGFLTSLLRAVRESWEIPVSGNAPTLQALLTKGFRDSICLSQHKYCLNYPTAIGYLDSLKQREDFTTYVKWCERNGECRRLYLRDLLVAPLQRLTRYPLLLRNVERRCGGAAERNAVQAVIELVERSIHELEGKVKWLDNYQKVKRLKESLVWEPVWERTRRAFVPESLRHLMKAASLENLVANRTLLYEGRLVLLTAESGKQQDVYMFLFDEFLLITKMKRKKRLSQRAGGSEQSSAHSAAGSQELQTLLREGCAFTVLDQPLSLDRVQLRNIDQLNASASGLLNSFMVTHQNRYLQCIAVFVLQAPSESAKKAWMLALEGAVEDMLKQDSQQPRLRNSAWLESTQI
ncbi:pleckstrin homology domain-containing family G member 7 isoform X1 [Anguilla rostrata]|uniref:pleckstrin homology domain-containing family G member 7 isoform X1 n=1 Tax=Anguilla rostrata TaxID=7938 RepID=UPI0030D23086